MKKVAVLLTVHNRREKTLACLENCYRQIDSMKGDDTYSFSVYLVDDGSTDGTSEAVLQTYPQTHVIKGDGSLFWNHGMRTAWDAAAADEQDFYLWLNDDTLMKEGVKAKLALEAGACTKAVEKVIEANTLLSGIGFESGGLAGAHAIHNGFTVLDECHHMYHGEKVAFGTITQLVLEDIPAEELEDIIDWCIELGLPVTLKELGITEVTDEKLMAVATAACAENDTLHNMPFEVTPETVCAAIKAADAYGRYFLGE